MLDLLELQSIAERMVPFWESPIHSFEVKGRKFCGHPNIDLMGVVNLSADSWYRESVCLSPESAIQRGLRLAVEGAAIVDLGGESTLLEAERVLPEDQLKKLLPVIEALTAKDVLVSVESYDPLVTGKALDAGAGIVNMTAAKDTSRIYEQVAVHNAGVVICYIEGGANAREVSTFDLEKDHAVALYEYFAREVEAAEKAGVTAMWIDPGLGFYYRNLMDSGERVRYQMRTFLESAPLRKLGWPLCQALPHAFEFFGDEVRSAEPFFAVLAAIGKTDLLRTHEISRVNGVIQTLASYEH